ncbi:MAG TPA: hypothetical protein VFW94_21565 [Candidatus Acidoferrales bacterium]|nr:hypothetical protein [Candidatus Acidoferrales bacterium]
MRPWLIRSIGFVAMCAMVFSLASTVRAGLRGRGKYCGVVVFDRWDTCFLLSGLYIMYVSDSVKEKLRPYTGQSLQIYASGVSQPVNPGDGLITKYDIIGPAPDRGWPQTDGIKIEIRPDFRAENTASFVVTVANTGRNGATIETSQLAQTLLGPNKILFTPSDGKSLAWITRTSMLGGDHFGKMHIDEKLISFGSTIDPGSSLPGEFDLAPGESRLTRITFRLPPGTYEFMIGYGGGVHEHKSVASNAVSFAVRKNGNVSLED